MQEFLQRHDRSVFRATLGSYDGIVLPASWLFLERILGHDCVGIRIGLPRASDVVAIDASKDLYLAMKKPNAHVQLVSDTLAMIS